MIAEITMGRAAKANPITALQNLSPKKSLPWWLVGVAGMAAAFLILSFYSEVVAWVFAYVFKAIGGSILSSDRHVTESAFGALIADPVQSLLWQWGVLVFIGGILLMGCDQGHRRHREKTDAYPCSCCCCCYARSSLSLDKAADGLAFLFRPDFSKITAGVILTAMGLAFFKLSLGMGTMMTYGSYFRDDQNIPQTTLRVMAADLCVSMLAGIAIFPAVFTFGFRTSGRAGAGVHHHPRSVLPDSRRPVADDRLLRAGFGGRHRRHAVADGSAGRDPARALPTSAARRPRC